MENNDGGESDLQTLRPKPVFLLLLDGWGIAAAGEANAISSARIPNFFKLAKEYPAAILEAGAGSVNARYLRLGAGKSFEDENSEVSSDLTKIISDNGLKQLKIFDSERLAALTSFFNGHREERIIGEEWLAISSKNDKQYFDIFLSLKRIVRESLKAIKSGNYDFIVAAAPILDSAASSLGAVDIIKAAEALDKAIRQLAKEIVDRQGVLLISSTHGNAERTKDMVTDLVDKDITDNPVPLIIVGPMFKGKTIGLKDAPDGDLSLLEPAGNLADVAPTILDLLEIEKNDLMAGVTLIVND
jgi:2,3-bisphosphoglycerate-independent phosphoglycerate mutase